MINAITRSLFTTPPRETLYHYTSLSGMMGIIGSRELRASDIRYMNDSAELRHTLDLLNRQVTRRILSGVDNPEHLNAFLDWLGGRIVSGPMLFGASFRANGNLLSQWRGYSVHGKGVSLGFDAGVIATRARLQGFSIGRCIYDPAKQEQLIEEVINGVEGMARDGRTPSTPEKCFEPIEEDLLRIAAVLKHPAFEEEQEWRIVSPMIDKVDHDAVHFREGASMLVPYYAFELADDSADGVSLDHVFIGPSSNAELSMHSIRLYLSQQGATPKKGVRYCQIPYRKR
jgi:hypothetical protein